MEEKINRECDFDISDPNLHQTQTLTLILTPNLTLTQS